MKQKAKGPIDADPRKNPLFQHNEAATLVARASDSLAPYSCALRACPRSCARIYSIGRRQRGRGVHGNHNGSPDPPPPENQPESDEGAQGDPGKEAVPEPVTAPTSRIETQPTPRPQASSTGTATRSGARDTGEGTGAAGTGTGTGSGNRGGGRGGVAVSKPVHISGSINNARDYPTPPGGREARRGTEVIVKVTVGVDGRARGCSIYRPSPDPEADRITCRLVEERLRFRPATDANGNSVPAPFYWRQRWF